MIENGIEHVSYKIIKNYREKYIKISSDWMNSIDSNPERGYDIIKQAILSDSPCMISRFGNTELDATLNYSKRHPLSFLRTIYPFWVGEETKNRMKTNAGFFPNDNKHLAQFADYITDICKDIDILGIWNGYENNIIRMNDCKMVPLWQLEPFWSKEPWTASLKGKKVLVIHPFEESIRAQYLKRKLLFENNDTLPDFKSFQVIKAIQSIGGENNGFASWFDALSYMKKKIDSVDYDVALIGCGAYGMPLASHCKRQGKKAVHIGGSLQLLFGIWGNRWESDDYPHKKLVNNYWIRPNKNERPPSANDVENACYW